jgi:hypothetical protein
MFGKAMSPAEKQRRYRERKAQKTFGNKDAVTKQDGRQSFGNKDAVTKRMAKLETEVATLRTENERLRRAKPVAGFDSGKDAQRKLGELETALAHKDQEIARLKARIAELQQERVGEARIAELKARIADLEAALRKTNRGFIWTTKECRNVEFCTHPDRVAFLKDEALTARFAAAFGTVKSSKGILVDKDAEEGDERLEKFSDQWRQAMSDRFAKQAAQERERKAKTQARYEARSAAAREAARKRKAASSKAKADES